MGVIYDGSSAYISTFDFLSESGQSLKNMRNNRGRSNDPCGTPLYI